MSDVFESLDEFADQAHENARNKGFHSLSDRLKAHIEALHETDPELADYIHRAYVGNRLMLIVGELTEAHEEVRSGHYVNETYYSEDASGKKKMEGVPSELADVAIRLGDTAAEFHVSLGDSIREKSGYNSGRENMHGRRF